MRGTGFIPRVCLLPVEINVMAKKMLSGRFGCHAYYFILRVGYDYPCHTAHLQHVSFADRLPWRLQ